MPDLYLSKVRLNGNTYHLKDSESRVLISNLSTPPLATPTSDGLMSAQDKQTLDNLNPNMTVTFTDINASEIHIINAKQEDLVDLEIIELPHISSQIRTSNLLDVSEGVPGSYLGSNGAPASNANDMLGPFIPITPGQDIYYTGTIGPTNSSSINRRLHVYDSTQKWIKQISYAGNLRIGNNWSTHGTVPANGAYIRVSWGVNDTNVMLSVGAPTQYEPYYITPFGVISSASFILANNEDYENAITYTVNVPAAAGDLYGFRYNPIQGKLYTTMGHITSYNGETLPDGPWISDRDVYEEGTTPSIGAQVIYKLEDEDVEEYDITLLTVPLFYHINYLKTETGQITRFVYYAETLSVTHLTIQDGATFGETDFFESDIQRWNHAADDIDLKANINSPTFTGTPSATTPALTTNSDRIATTAYTNNMLNSIVAPVEPTPTRSSNNYSVGQLLILQGKLYKVTAPIAQNSTLTVGTNIEATDIATELNLLLSLIS